jgi:TetR/AcrR family transcriptional repressor of uid operon
VSRTDPTANRILDEAYDAMLAFGVRRVSVEEVARRAGINRITVYRRFATRDALVQAVLAREARALFDTVDAMIRTLPTEAALAEGFAVILEGVRGHPLVKRTLETEPELVAELLVTQGAPLMVVAREYLAAHLREAQRAGHLAPFEVGPVAELMVRITASLLLTPESCIRLTDHGDALSFATRYLLPLLRVS